MTQIKSVLGNEMSFFPHSVPEKLDNIFLPLQKTVRLNIIS